MAGEATTVGKEYVLEIRESMDGEPFSWLYGPSTLQLGSHAAIMHAGPRFYVAYGQRMGFVTGGLVDALALAMTFLEGTE